MSKIRLSAKEARWCKVQAVKDWFYPTQGVCLSAVQLYEHVTRKGFAPGGDLGWALKHQYQRLDLLEGAACMKQAHDKYREAMRFAIESRKSAP